MLRVPETYLSLCLPRFKIEQQGQHAGHIAHDARMRNQHPATSRLSGPAAVAVLARQGASKFGLHLPGVASNGFASGSAVVARHIRRLGAKTRCLQTLAVCSA